MDKADPIVSALAEWDEFAKVPGFFLAMTVYDDSAEPRPQGRYLLLSWNGKEDKQRLYRSRFRRYCAYLRVKWEYKTSQEIHGS
jgi:hypothetical protein